MPPALGTLFLLCITESTKSVPGPEAMPRKVRTIAGSRMIPIFAVQNNGQNHDIRRQFQRLDRPLPRPADVEGGLVKRR